MNKCRLCNYEWKSRGDKIPKCCPKCKIYNWQMKIPKTYEDHLKEAEA
jgi:predicted Zn-ribbon and HTH transcriptional regulator